MLTAAVYGGLFASPCADAVFNAIMAVTGSADRLNFGLAAEKAKKAGLKVEMVIAGTVMVHKIAGHAAEQSCR